MCTWTYECELTCLATWTCICFLFRSTTKHHHLSDKNATSACMATHIANWNPDVTHMHKHNHTYIYIYIYILVPANFRARCCTNMAVCLYMYMNVCPCVRAGGAHIYRWESGLRAEGGDYLCLCVLVARRI
jgi:hypothetical protein